MASDIKTFHLPTDGLQKAYESSKIPSVTQKDLAVPYSSYRKEFTPEEIAAALDPRSNPQGFKSLWTKAFAVTQRKVQEKDARLGRETAGTFRGKDAVKMPTGKIKVIKGFGLK